MTVKSYVQNLNSFDKARKKPVRHMRMRAGKPYTAGAGIPKEKEPVKRTFEIFDAMDILGQFLEGPEINTLADYQYKDARDFATSAEDMFVNRETGDKDVKSWNGFIKELNDYFGDTGLSPETFDEDFEKARRLGAKDKQKRKKKAKYKCSGCGERAVVKVGPGSYECRNCGGAGDKQGMVEGAFTDYPLDLEKARKKPVRHVRHLPTGKIVEAGHGGVTMPYKPSMTRRSDEPGAEGGVVFPKEKKKEIFWAGSDPTHCDLCKKPFGDTFIDGATAWGPWGNMCPSCHASQGGRLGIGLGQKYQRQNDGRWKQVAGGSGKYDSDEDFAERKKPIRHVVHLPTGKIIEAGHGLKKLMEPVRAKGKEEAKKQMQERMNEIPFEEKQKIINEQIKRSGTDAEFVDEVFVNGIADTFKIPLSPDETRRIVNEYKDEPLEMNKQYALIGVN